MERAKPKHVKKSGQLSKVIMDGAIYLFLEMMKHP
jgi:hypothetical protein